MNPHTTRRRPEPELPPNNLDAENGLLGCVFQAAELHPAEVEHLALQLRPEFFYHAENQAVFKAMALFFQEETHKFSFSVFTAWCKQNGHPLDAMGGLARLAGLADCTPSVFQFGEFLRLAQECSYRRRLLYYQVKLGELAQAPEVKLEAISNLFAEVTERASKFSDRRPALTIKRADEWLAYKPPTTLCLIGENEVYRGYDGICLIAGPGGSGKSLVALNLALAGAMGSGLWQGRRVHRRFKTLILQAENGGIRVKHELSLMKQTYPDAPIDEHIFISEPPEGGIPFHKPEFRRAVAKAVRDLGVDLVQIDPWSHVQVEDSSKDVSEKLAEIRSCFPAGDAAPALLICAHTKKPRTEGIKRGRALVNEIAGSVTLSNTARTAYVLLPFSDDQDDHRVLWSIVKCNNGPLYTDTVWHRKVGTFFEHDGQTDPSEFWRRDEPGADSRAIEESDLVKAFGSEHVLSKSTLARRLEEVCGASYATAMRAISPGRGGYLAHLVKMTQHGIQILNGD